MERALDKLAQNPKAIESLAEMNRVIDSGERGNYESMDFYHNLAIDRIFTEARRKAWAGIMMDPKVQTLINDAKLKKIKRLKKRDLTTQNRLENVLSLPK